MPASALDQLAYADVEAPAMPVIFGAVDLVAYLIDRGSVLTVEELVVALYRVPGRDSPLLLDALYRHQLLTDDGLSGFVGLTWSITDWPELVLSQDRWRQLFAAAGYTEDGQRVPRPSAPLQLFRGSVADRRADWSWTGFRDVARTYAAGGFGGRLPGAVWARRRSWCANSSSGEPS